VILNTSEFIACKMHHYLIHYHGGM